MKYSEWRKIYKKILDDFSIEKKQDERAARILTDYRDQSVSLKDIREIVNDEVIILGNASILKKQLTNRVRFNKTVIAADGATEVAINEGIVPDLVVTDLDGDMTSILKAHERGSVLVVHAHGDNIDKIKKWCPKIDKFLSTTQAKPFNAVYNFGGFTDGDRAVFLAVEFGARDISLYGFDYKDAKDRKYKKLQWAKKLIEKCRDKNDVNIHHIH
ncbi:MAG: 78-Dihydro-6-hydroxymethylpterin-pyrophosphokinase HPPK Rossmann fold enzyme [Candidatus Methanohalarchaeum thermophilum]|uniref:6-hydroxymethyl-7,8-dihydropterin pyrophosphokinase n=1 Tax=Methanohalarchaeum thermophilum TaxID=1903181 RepID=A0A1Q6DW36_METT1|nr:MAG: 78-Dihydro-6-hydroxymethylpterin-pyrophosphokinase HPPK Rossmann fold enzyme [Candidatus Methanohalarchaeum thermophilum]